MKLKDACLNHNHPTVIAWFNTYGVDETYRQYVINDGVLPDKPLYAFNDVREYLNNFIPANEFKYKNIKTILSELPVEAQAAFWKDTFYFKDLVSKNEINEELFHSIVSSILPVSERAELFKEGAKLINVKEKVKQLSALYPKTYDLLSAEEKEERVVEEHLASLFVASFKTPSVLDRVGDFIKRLFDTIKGLFGMGNRDYINTIFDEIKSGKYRNAKVIYSESATPSTYIVKGKTITGITEQLGEAESEQILRNLTAIYFDQRQKQSVPEDQLIERTIDIARTYYELDPNNRTIAGAFESKIEDFDLETSEITEIDNPDYLELIDELNARIARISPFIFDLIEEDQGDVITDENADSEYANLSEFNSADEAGFDNISAWLKMYISTVGTPVEIEVGTETVEFLEAVDQNKIYYGVARALNNSKNDFERLIQLIEFASIESNTAARALLTKLIRDVTGSKDTSIIKNIQNDYLNEYLQTGDASIINKYIHPSRSYILQNVLKGFDLWSNNSQIQTISPETGNTYTFSDNVNSSVNTQIANWQQNSLTIGKLNVNGLKPTVSISGDFYSKLKLAVSENVEILRNGLGVEMSPETIRYLLINSAIKAYGSKVPLIAEDITKYNAFKSNIDTYGSEQEIISLLDNIVKHQDTLYTESEGRLDLLAKINGVFDESVFESSYKTADGKTRYAFQRKTFHLEFNKNFQNLNFLSSLINKGIVSYRTDSKRNKIYLNEPKDFIENNIFLKQLFEFKNGSYQVKEGRFKNILPYIQMIQAGGLRQTAEGKEGREGDGVTFTNILTKDFDLVRLNYVVNKTVRVEGEVLYPHYIGNLEAKRTADFMMLPELRDVANQSGLTLSGISYLKEEIRKEYDRIQRVHSELKEAIEKNPDLFKVEDGIVNLSSGALRKALNKDVYEKYHTGAVQRDTIGESYIYRSKGVRALEFTDSVAGILPKDFMRSSLVDAALSGQSLEDFWKSQNLDEMIKNHWNNTIFTQHLDKLQSNDIIENLDKNWKVDGKLNTEKYFNFITSSFINTLAFNQVIQGDPALLYKNDGADMYKRFGGRNAAIQSSETYLINPDLGITEVKDLIKYVVGKEFKSKVAYDPSTSIDQADAQNYATTEYKRYLLWSQGKLTKFLAKTLDDIELGLPLSEAQNRVILSNKQFLNVDKTVAFNGIQYLKKSDFMLTKEFTSMLKEDVELRLRELDPYSEEARKIRMDENNWIARPDVEFHHNLRQNMEGWRDVNGTLVKDNSKKYDLYMPMSASKMLNVNVYDPSEGWNNVDGSVVHIEAKNYGLQLENPAGKKRIIDPSQMIEIVFNEQSDEAEVIYKGKPVKVVDLESVYQDYLKKRDNSMFDIAYNELIDENDEFDAETFFPKAVRSLVNSGADPQTIKVFQSVEGGKPVYNPNIGITKDKFTNLLFAHITKGVLQQKIAGDALAHVSSYGIKPVKQIRKIKIGNKFDYTWDVVPRDSLAYKSIAYNRTPITKLNLESTVKDSVIFDPTLESDALRSTLKDLYESAQVEGQSEVPVYFTDELRHLKPRYNIVDFGTNYSEADGVIAYYSESLMPASRLDDQKITSNNRWNFGVRIPSQDKHSAVNVEWIDALPIYYGNTIMTAKEIVALSGSDFDIDKLFVHKPELYKLGKNWVKYGTGDKWREYIEFLKDTNTEFKNSYNTIREKLFKRDEEFDAEYNDLRDQLAVLKSQLKSTKNLDERAIIREQIKAVQTSVENYEEEYSINNQYLKEQFPKEVKELLKSMRLPTDISNWNNPYEINNELLDLKQLALTNSGTIVGNDATYKTSATMSKLADLDKNDPDFIKGGVNNISKLRNINMIGRGVYNNPDDGNSGNDIFIVGNNKGSDYLTVQDEFHGIRYEILKTQFENEEYKISDPSLLENGVSVFAQTDELPAHIFDKHSVTHTKNTVGKQNINPYVNGNLGLILAIRAGYSINPDFIFSINGHTASGFGYLSQEGQRVFDTLSTLISAATDEAKEQLNAKYNLNLDGAVLAKTMVSLGFDLKTSIAFVNQPIVQSYLKEKQNRNKTVFLKKEYKSAETIIYELAGDIESGRYLGEYGNKELTDNIKGELDGDVKKFNKRIMADLLTVEKINAQLSQLTRFLKVKKGFVDGLNQLDQLNDAVGSLGFELSAKSHQSFMENNPLNTHETFINENIYSKIPQIENVYKRILPATNNLTRKLLLSRNYMVQGLKQRVYSNLKNLNEEDQTRIEREIDSYTYMRLYLNSGADVSLLTNNLFKRGESHATVGKTFLDLKAKVEEAYKKTDRTEDEKLLADLHGTSILKRLTVKYNKKQDIDELKLDTFSKLTVEQQDTLITSYGMLIKNLSYLSDEYLEFKNLPQQMFAYWAMKDGFQNKFGSIAKLFPIHMFKVHSNTIDALMNNEIDSEQFVKIAPRDVLKRIAQNRSTQKSLKTFYSTINPDSDVLHTGYVLNLKKLTKDKFAATMMNYPFEHINGVITSIPMYVRAANTSLEAKKIAFKDGRVVENTDEEFFRMLNNSNDIGDIAGVQYEPIKVSDVSYQSVMTIDMNYSGIDRVENVENIEEEVESVEDTTGCTNSLES